MRNGNRDYEASYAKLVWAQNELRRIRDAVTPAVAPCVARKIRPTLKSLDGAIRNADRFRKADVFDQQGRQAVRSADSGLLASILPGDRVTIVTPQGNRIRGRAVMRGPAGWVINRGGKYGTPYVADERNIVCVGRAR